MLLENEFCLVEGISMSKAVAVSDTGYEKLAQAAQSRSVSVEQLLDELLHGLPSHHHAVVIDALSRGGLAPLPADAFTDFIDPAANYEAIRHALAQKSFTLSETILAERG
jgi:hypothetical protein